MPSPRCPCGKLQLLEERDGLTQSKASEPVRAAFALAAWLVVCSDAALTTDVLDELHVARRFLGSRRRAQQGENKQLRSSDLMGSGRLVMGVRDLSI